MREKKKTTSWLRKLHDTTCRFSRVSSNLVSFRTVLENHTGEQSNLFEGKKGTDNTLRGEPSEKCAQHLPYHESLKTLGLSSLGRTTTPDLEKAEEFNGQITDVFSKNEHTQVPLLDRSATFMNDIAVSTDGVIKLLKGLNPSKALWLDELHPRVLKELATELGPVFAHLLQQSIDTVEIPKEWSLANICPLFKENDRSLACNYRPVSLTCVPCK